MNWFLSILIGLLTAVVGLFSTGYLASLNVRWYRISSFEGGSGYYVVFLALLGGIAGLVVGVVCSRVIAVWTEPTFPKGLGFAVGSMLALVFAIGVVCWLAADFPPEMDGKSVELAIEVKAPRRLQFPITVEEYGAHAYIDLNSRKRTTQADLRLDEAREVDGQWIVTATVPLRTSARDKRLRAYFNKDNDAFFPLPRLAHPTAKDLEWSGWIEAMWNFGNGRPDAENAFHMRYKVQVIEPPPPPEPVADQEARAVAAEQAAFEALAPDAPLMAWLNFAGYGASPERLAAVNENIASRENFVAELSALMLGDDHEVSAQATRWIEHLELFPEALIPAVAASGRKIADMTRAFNATSVEDDPGMQGAADVSIRFSAWMVAVRTLRTQSNGDFTPELQEILTLSRVREDSHAMQADVRRVASYYLKEWAGVQPLAGDPQPR